MTEKCYAQGGLVSGPPIQIELPAGSFVIPASGVRRLAAAGLLTIDHAARVAGAAVETFHLEEPHD